MSDIEPAKSYEVMALADARDAYGFAAISAFGLATELGSVSEELVCGAALCISISAAIDIARRFLERYQLSR